MFDKKLLGVFTLVLLTACGGGGSSGGGGSNKNLIDPAQNFTLSYEPVKTIKLSWDANPRATHYKVYEKRDNSSGFEKLATLDDSATEYTLTVPLYLRLNAQYRLESCDDGGCNASSNQTVDKEAMALAAGYLKGSNTRAQDTFGTDVSISADGLTLAVGAHREGSPSTVINEGQQSNVAGDRYGAVYVFIKTDGQWEQQAYIKPNANFDNGDHFGITVSLSKDGNRLAVGAKGESSKDPGNGANNDAGGAGAAYLFYRDNGEWSQHAYLKASNPTAGDEFGSVLWLSDDGKTLAVGALSEDSPAIHGEANFGDGEADNNVNDTAENYGAVYVFTEETDNQWVQQAYIKPDEKIIYGYFGGSVELSGDGNVLAVGTGSPYLDGEPHDGGRLYIYQREDSDWNLDYSFYPEPEEPHNFRSNHVAISADGKRVVSRFQNHLDSVQLHVLTSINGDWVETKLEPINSERSNVAKAMPGEVDISENGSIIAVGLPSNTSCMTGFNNATSGNCVDSGAVVVYQNTGDSWHEVAYIKTLDDGDNRRDPTADERFKMDDRFGRRLSLSGDGQTLAVGSLWEDNGSKSGSFQVDDSAAQAGAVYIF